MILEVHIALKAAAFVRKDTDVDMKDLLSEWRKMTKNTISPIKQTKAYLKCKVSINSVIYANNIITYYDN